MNSCYDVDLLMRKGRNKARSPDVRGQAVKPSKALGACWCDPSGVKKREAVLLMCSVVSLQ
jgi:hypothetical protein